MTDAELQAKLIDVQKSIAIVKANGGPNMTRLHSRARAELNATATEEAAVAAAENAILPSATATQNTTAAFVSLLQRRADLNAERQAALQRRQAVLRQKIARALARRKSQF